MSISVGLNFKNSANSTLKAPNDAKKQNVNDSQDHANNMNIDDINTWQKEHIMSLIDFTYNKTDILNKYEYFSEVLFMKVIEEPLKEKDGTHIISEHNKTEYKKFIKMLLSLNVDVLFIEELVMPLISNKNLRDDEWINKLIVAIAKTMSPELLQEFFADKTLEEIFIAVNSQHMVYINNQPYTIPLNILQSNDLYSTLDNIKNESNNLSLESYYMQLDFALLRDNINVTINNGVITDIVEANKYAYGVWMKKINEILVKTLHHKNIMAFSEQDVLSIIFSTQHSKNNINFNSLSQDLNKFQEQLNNLDDSNKIKILHNEFVNNIKEYNFSNFQIIPENVEYINFIINFTAFMMIKVNCGLEFIHPQERTFLSLQNIMEGILDSNLLSPSINLYFNEPNNHDISHWGQKIEAMMPKNKAGDNNIPRELLLELDTKEVVIIEHNKENQVDNLTSTYNINTRKYEIADEDSSNVKDSRITSVSVIGIERLAIPYNKMEAIRKIMTEGIKDNQEHKNNIPVYTRILSDKISELNYMLLQVREQILSLSLELPQELASAKCAILEHIATEQLKCLIAYYTEASENLDKINKYTINNAVMTSKLPDVYCLAQVSHQSDSYIITDGKIEEIISEQELEDIFHDMSKISLSINPDVIISSSLENQKNNSKKISLYYTPINNKFITGVRFRANFDKELIPLVYSRKIDLEKTAWEKHYYKYSIDPNIQDQDLFKLLKKIIENKYTQDDEAYLQQHRMVMIDCIRIINNKLDNYKDNPNDLEFYMQLLEQHIIYGQYERRSKDDIYNKFIDKINNKNFVINNDDININKRIIELNRLLKYLYHIEGAEDNELLLINQ